MLTEHFIAATLSSNKSSRHAIAAYKDVGVFFHEFQPQTTFRHGFKKSSANPGCIAISDTHVFAAQADKAVINVYNREKGNQEATVPFPERIHCIKYAQEVAVLIIGTEGGKVVLWEVTTGRLTNSAASHIQPVSEICIDGNNDYILSGSADSDVHVWSFSNLISFSQLGKPYGNGIESKVPLRTFSHHRHVITAIATGHSKSSTNFAVSVSKDQTCYLWHVETCEILRTILLPSISICAILDPIDRAIYFGDDAGRVMGIDILGSSTNPRASLFEAMNEAPIQLTEKGIWLQPSAELGSTNCMTLAYDGTTLLSGHEHGAITRWDVAKRRAINEVVNYGQSVTNIQMTKLNGFENVRRSRFNVSAIIKPNLEFNAQGERAASGIPVNYSFNASILPPESNIDEITDDFSQALQSDGFPQAILDNAIRSIDLMSGGKVEGSDPNPDNNNLYQTKQLEGEVAKLKQQLAVLNNVEAKRLSRRQARMEKRDELGLKRRQAYFEAKKQGKDGDAAMKEWEEKEAMLDVESDDEYLGEGMDIG